jgi:hypothetical protein
MDSRSGGLRICATVDPADIDEMIAPVIACGGIQPQPFY